MENANPLAGSDEAVKDAAHRMPCPDAAFIERRFCRLSRLSS